MLNLAKFEVPDNSLYAPTRMSVARRVNSLSKAELSRVLGVAPSSITAYENGSRLPPTETIQKAAEQLGFPYSFFCGDDFDLLDTNTPTFRSRRSLKAVTRDRVIGLAEIAINCISPALRNRFELPIADLLDLSNEPNPEVAAVTMRNHWKLGNFPIPNMVSLLESKGIEVYWLNEDSASVDALSIPRDRKSYVLLNLCERAGDRDRLNAAHELAHLVMHSDKSRIVGRDIEDEAFKFAAAFLMPASAFRADCPRFPILDQFARLKRKWGVSVAAMIRRAKDLGILSEWHYVCACREIAIRNWRKREPDSIAIANEESLIHQKIFENLLQKGITPSHFANTINVPDWSIHTLMPKSIRYDLPSLKLV